MTGMHAEQIKYALMTLWQETEQAHFLHTLTMHETIAVLEKRRDLAEHLLAQINREAVHSQRADEAALIMLDHSLTLLNAELGWLDRTIHSLRARISIQEY
jgi:type II secretory pathway component PulL